MRRILFSLCGVLLLSAQAPANPVITHYRAYNAALERGDLAAAESEASQAYDASVSQDGAGGRTGVLAVNVAKIRLHNGHVLEAYGPAQQAFAIASANPAAGVDPLLASLLLGRAELTPQHDEQGRPRLLAALEQATSHPEVGADAYDAAVQLAQFSVPHEDFGLVPGRQGDPNITASAWSYAARFAQYTSGDHQLAFAEARLAEGVSRTNAFYRDPIKLGPAELTHAVDALVESARILGPMAAQRSGAELTLAQRDYGYALAWARRAGALYAHPDIFTNALGDGLQAGAPATPFCPIHIIAEPAPNYPAHAVSIEREGIVVVRVLIDNGQATDVRVAAAVPGFWFADAVTEVAPRWRAEVWENAPDDCTMPSVNYGFVVFMLRP